MSVRGIIVALAISAGSLGGVGSGACLAASPARAGEGPDMEKLVAAQSPNVVTIKCVMKFEIPGMGDHEQETEVSGLMIDPQGLVLVSNTQMGGLGALMRRMRGAEFSVKPTKIRVLVGEDTVGQEAKLIARDSELDLAWVRVDKAPAKPFEFLDLGKHADAKLGEPLYVVARTGKFFDRVPMIAETRVAAVAKKPRSLYVISEGGGGLAMPAFNAAGVPVGVVVLQMPSDDEEGEGGMMGGGGGGGPAILPIAEVKSATERALKTAEGEHSEEPAKKEPEAAKPEKAPGK
jgi:hypothetical protein